MARAARIKAGDIFNPIDWAELSARSYWIGPALVVHCWAVIALAMICGIVWPVTIPVMIMIIGTRQLGLAILMHDAAHYALHPNPAFNDFLGDYFCGGPVKAYRKYHLSHHKFAQQAEDPDLILSAPFPTTRASLKRKIIRDLTGQTFFKQRLGMLYAAWVKPVDGPRLPVITQELWRLRRYIAFNALGIAALSWFGAGWAWIILWMVPQATWLPLVTRLRNIAEHALVAKNEPDPFHHARSTHANWLERAFIAPYWVNYHGEHHLFMYVPCWKLPGLRRALEQRGLASKLLTAPGYLSVMKTVTSR